MIESLWLMYFVWLASSLKSLFIGFAVLSAIAGLVMAIAFGKSYKSETPYFLKKMKQSAVCFCFCCAFATILPHKSDMLFIVGGAGAIAVASDPQVQGTARQALEWVGRQLEAGKKSTP